MNKKKTDHYTDENTIQFLFIFAKLNSSQPSR